MGPNTFQTKATLRRLAVVALAPLWLASLSLSCESAEAKRCRAEYLATHALVPGIDVDDSQSVEKGLAAVEKTKRACEAAGLREELAELEKVENPLRSHFDYLRTHGKQKQLSPEELERLQTSGDPACPEGQAYKPKNSEQQIRCTGPRLADMNWSQAKMFYGNRGFKITEIGSVLKAEYGSESYSYEFGKTEDARPASCVRVFVAPGISWQESAARMTGARPHRLEYGKPVKTSRGMLALSHTEDEVQAIYQLGDCK